MSESKLTVLDKQQVRAAFERAAATYDEAAVLQRQVGDQMLERLDIMRIAPRVILDLGSGTGYCTRALADKYPRARVLALDIAHGMLARTRPKRRWFKRSSSICADAELLPLADDSVDLLFSNLLLQWCNPQRLFAECLRVLRPGGVLMFSTFGPDTLRELRDAWRAVDDGVHVHDFVDMHDLGDVLVHAGFAEPVMDTDHYTLTYANVVDVLRDLKALGAHNAAHARRHGLTGKRRFGEFRQAYETLRDADGRIPSTYEVSYGHAWAPVVARAAGTNGGQAVVSVDQLRRGRT